MKRAAVQELYDKYAWDISDLARNDIARFQSTPGLVSSYLYGQSVFLKVRRLMEGALGERFSLPEFHDQVLSQGEVPLDYLEQFVIEYVTCRRRGGHDSCSLVRQIEGKV